MQIEKIENRNIITWTEFFENFRDHQNEFIKRLTNSYPNLRMTEFKLCCLMLAGFATTEISKLTNRTIRSVETAKYRLRKKLPLTTNDDLTIFLMRI